jgi:hypothetical protein
MGCAHKSAKIGIGTEYWLVDPNEIVFYRVISDKKEQVIQIVDNPDMKKFVCIDKREVYIKIEEAIEEDK